MTAAGTAGTAGPAAEAWAEALAAWAIPEDILAAAPESPWGFPVALFHPAEDEPADTPSRQAALDALGGDNGRSVLDVGCGAGAASLALVPPAARVIGVDSSTDMLAAFARGAGQRGVAHVEVQGRWPDVADRVTERADVVVCHHVFYNAPDLPAFVGALTDHADRRVVCELSAAHPQIALNDLWRHFWDLDRPRRPLADDAVAVLRELGIDPHVDRWRRPARRAHRLTRAEEVAFTRRRLCLPAERDAEIDALLPPSGGLVLDDLVTLWWDVAGVR